MTGEGARPSRETLSSKGESKIGRMLGAKLIEEEVLKDGMRRKDMGAIHQG